MAGPISTTVMPGGGQRQLSQELRMQRDVLTFHIASEEYGIGIEHIREIIKYRPITEVPRVPGFVAGIIAVRGLVMPVLDMRVRLRLTSPQLSPKSRILVVSRPSSGNEVASEEERERFGLLVDRVNEVVRIYETDIELPTVLSGKESEFIEGIGRQRIEEDDMPRQVPRMGSGVLAEPRRIIILLDLTRVLTFEVGRYL